MAKTDEELRKNFKISVVGQIVSVKIQHTEQNEDDSFRVMELAVGDVTSIFNKSPDKKYCLLVDMLSNENRKISNKTTEITDKFLENEQIEKIAILGLGKALSVMVNFSSIATGMRGRVRLFSNEEAAIEWLKPS